MTWPASSAALARSPPSTAACRKASSPSPRPRSRRPRSRGRPVRPAPRRSRRAGRGPPVAAPAAAVRRGHAVRGDHRRLRDRQRAGVVRDRPGEPELDRHRVRRRRRGPPDGRPRLRRRRRLEAARPRGVRRPGRFAGVRPRRRPGAAYWPPPRSASRRPPGPKQKRDAEVSAADERYTPALANADKKRETSLAALDAELQGRRRPHQGPARERSRGGRGLAPAHTSDLQLRQAREPRPQGAFDRQTRDSHAHYQQSREALERRLREGLESTRPHRHRQRQRCPHPALVGRPGVGDVEDAAAFTAAVRFGELEVDLKKIAETFPAPASPPRRGENRPRRTIRSPAGRRSGTFGQARAVGTPPAVRRAGDARLPAAGVAADPDRPRRPRRRPSASCRW